MLEHSIPHFVCRQEVYLQQSSDRELVRGNVKGLNWTEIIRYHCPVSSLNETLLRVIRNRVLKQTIAVRMGDKPKFDNRCVLAHRAKQRAYRVWRRSRTQDDCRGSRGWLIVMFS